MKFKSQWTKNYPLSKHGENHSNAVHLPLILLSTCQIGIGQSFYRQAPRYRGFDNLCHNANKDIIRQRHDFFNTRPLLAATEISQFPFVALFVCLSWVVYSCIEFLIFIRSVLSRSGNTLCRSDLGCCFAEVQGGRGALLGGAGARGEAGEGAGAGPREHRDQVVLVRLGARPLRGQRPHAS